MSGPEIELKSVGFRYPRDGFAVEVEDLRFSAGEKVALTGRSGCGKTTLANLIAGILQPQCGTIRIGDQQISSLADADRRAYRIANIGFIFQDFALLDYLSARDNLLLPFAINRRLNATSADRERADALAESMGLADRLDRRPAQLSGGERQRLAIARALVTEPRLVIADEPTGNLDRETAAEVLAEILERISGATLLAITHDESILENFDRNIDVSAFAR